MRPLTFGELQLFVDPYLGSAELTDSVRNERLIVFPNLALLVPCLDEAVSVDGVVECENRIVACLSAESFKARLRLEQTGTCLTISSEIEVLRSFDLNRLSIVPAGTALNLYDVINYRNRHYTPNTWPEQLLGGKGCETDTFSRDWQFAPHPSMMMIRKSDVTLCLGALDLPTSFGMYLKASDFHINDLSLDYGGLALRAGDRFVPPRFCLFLDRYHDPYETTRRYTEHLIEQGLIPDPSKKTRYAWHRDSVYCTWMDQGFIAKDSPEDELGLQQLTGSNPTVEALSESFVRETLDCMDREGLKFGIYLLDDGWQVTRGQWEPHPERFPNLRGLVDEIHQRGMKVVVWWNWAELFDDAEVDPAHLAGDGWRNEHGRRMRDYSNPRTQEEYFKPFFRKLFSSDPDCYDFDGFKSDFLADKVHPDLPIHDPAWRGEENYCYRLFELCYRTMRVYKEDGCHIGCVGHPYLAEFVDVNRTYDVATSNYLEHANRAKMLNATMHGCSVAFDLHNFIERFEEYFACARCTGASFHIGNILGMKRDRLSPWEPADAGFYDIMRRGLDG